MKSRVLKGNDHKLTHTFYAQDEETATDATGNVTVTVVREDGTALTGGTIASNNGTTGQYDFDLTAASHVDELDDLVVTWSATVGGRTVSEHEYVKVVGARYFTISALRALKGLSSTSTFTNTELQSARDIAEDFVENFTEHSFVPVYRREVRDGDGLGYILLEKLSPRRLIEVSVSGTVSTTTDWTINEQGLLRTTGDRFTEATPQGHNIVIKYEWGEPGPNLDLQRATLALARYILLNAESSIPDRARLMQTEWAMFHLDTASEEKPTGLPEVDAVLCRYRHEQPGWVFG